MNSDTNKIGIEVELGSDVLALIERLYALSDTRSLDLLHTILSKLILSNVRDADTSFVDLSEYCASLILALGGSADALNESKNLKALIAHDLYLAGDDSSVEYRSA
jgi:hypothetical protein